MSTNTQALETLPAHKRLETQVAIAALDYLKAVATGLNRPIDSLTADDLVAWASR